MYCWNKDKAKCTYGFSREVFIDFGESCQRCGFTYMPPLYVPFEGYPKEGWCVRFYEPPYTFVVRDDGEVSFEEKLQRYTAFKPYGVGIRNPSLERYKKAMEVLGILKTGV